MAGYGEWCEQDVGINGCVGPYVCFVNATWNNDVSLCTCSLWYGWRGEQCLEFSGPTFFIIISAGLQGLLGVLALIIALDGIVKYVRFIGLHINTQVLTMGLIGAALTVLVGWRAVSIAIACTPQLYVFETVSNSQGRSHKYIFGERSLLSATLCFGTLALLNISLVWVEVALQSRRVTQKTFSGLTSYRRTVYVFEFVLTTGLFTLNAKGLTALVSLYAAPFLIFITVVFAYGAKHINTLTEAFKTESNSASGDETRAAPSKHMLSLSKKYTRIVKSIQRTALRVVICVACGLLSGVIYTIFTMLGQRTFLSPEAKVHLVVVANEGVPLFTLFALLPILRYVHKSISKSLRSKARASRGRVHAKAGPIHPSEQQSQEAILDMHIRTSHQPTSTITEEDLEATS